jgi:hypothetical protein
LGPYTNMFNSGRATVIQRSREMVFVHSLITGFCWSAMSKNLGRKILEKKIYCVYYLVEFSVLLSYLPRYVQRPSIKVLDAYISVSIALIPIDGNLGIFRYLGA